jgi:hypothetical protein
MKLQFAILGRSMGKTAIHATASRVNYLLGAIFYIAVIPTNKKPHHVATAGFLIF